MIFLLLLGQGPPIQPFIQHMMLIAGVAAAAPSAPAKGPILSTTTYTFQ